MSEPWYNQRTHSTQDIEPPKLLDVKPKTPEDLYAWAERVFGLTREIVKDTMRYYGHTIFYPDSWALYVGLIKQTVKDMEAREEYPNACPLCGAVIERDTKKDNLYGVKWGWRCTADRFHFMQHRVNVLRVKNETCDSDPNKQPD